MSWIEDDERIDREMWELLREYYNVGTPHTAPVFNVAEAKTEKGKALVQKAKEKLPIIYSYLAENEDRVMLTFGTIIANVDQAKLEKETAWVSEGIEGPRAMVVELSGNREYSGRELEAMKNADVEFLAPYLTFEGEDAQVGEAMTLGPQFESVVRLNRWGILDSKGYDYDVQREIYTINKDVFIALMKLRKQRGEQAFDDLTFKSSSSSSRGKSFIHWLGGACNRIRQDPTIDDITALRNPRRDQELITVDNAICSAYQRRMDEKYKKLIYR